MIVTQTNLEGIVQSPKLRILFLRGESASRRAIYDPTNFLKRRGELSVPQNPLEALLEIIYTKPDVVVADIDYTADFSTEITEKNSLVSVLVDKAPPEEAREHGQFTGLDFLRLAASNEHTRAIISGRDRKRPPSSIYIEQSRRAREQIVYIPRGQEASDEISDIFRKAVRNIIDEACTLQRQAPSASPAVGQLEYNFYIFIGAPSSGKSRTIRHIRNDEKQGFPVWEIPKVSTREQRENSDGDEFIHVDRNFFDNHAPLFATWDMFGERYGIPIALSRERLDKTNIFLGTVSGEIVKKLSHPELLNGKVIPVLLYPPPEFVKARIANDPHKQHRLPEIDVLYESYDALIRSGAIKYVIRFNPDDVTLNGDLGHDHSKILEERLDEAIDSVVMRRVDAMLHAEQALKKPANNGEPAKIPAPQEFYNSWVDRFVSTFFPDMKSFAELDRAVNEEKRAVTLFPADKEEAVREYASLLERTTLSSVKENHLKTLAPRTVVAVGKAYGMAYIFLNPAILKYGWGTESELVRMLVYQKAMPLFPTTIRTRDTEPYSQDSGFAYVTSPDNPQAFSDMYQWRLTDHDVDDEKLDPKEWPVRGITIGFARTQNIVPVSPTRHEDLREENYRTVVYRVRTDTPITGNTPPDGSSNREFIKIQEPPVQQ